jgi:hypothetical protein
MTTRSTMMTLATTVTLALAANATAIAQQMARNLEAELNRTGQVAVPDLRGDGKGIRGTPSIADRPEARVRFVPSGPRKATVARISLRDDPTLSSQYGGAFTTLVEGCRFDVARRRGVTPGEIAAGVVTVRWTIEPSGRVRDLSAIARSPTDSAVTSCTKLVIAGRALLNPVEEPLALEWTYAFRKIHASSRKMPIQEKAHEQ